jgi:hypothetical protein
MLQLKRIKEIISELIGNYPINSEYMKVMHERLRLLQDDIKITEDSFIAKDSIKGREREAKTQELAINIYGARLHTLLFDLYNEKKEPELIERVNEIRSDISNKYDPPYLLFSQQQHNSRFSRQSLFAPIHEKRVFEVVSFIRNGEYLTDNFPVHIFGNDFRDSFRWFAINNRTYVALSQAHVDHMRLIPVLPTQSDITRLNFLEGNPNFIFAEYPDSYETQALKFCNSPRLVR